MLTGHATGAVETVSAAGGGATPQTLPTMARSKRISNIVTRARTRAAALASIDPNLDLGNGMTLAAFNKSVDGVDAKLKTYNTKLSELDGLKNELEAGEKDLDQLASRMLGGVVVKFGRDSDQYEKAGGVRTSERAKAKRAGAASSAAKS